MTINSIRRNAGYSTDPTAASVGTFLARRDTLATTAAYEPATATRALSLEELYPSLFAEPEPRLDTLLRDAVTAINDALTAAVTLVARRMFRRRRTSRGAKQ